jgi:outer membrane protein assembly factor BamB
MKKIFFLCALSVVFFLVDQPAFSSGEDVLIHVTPKEKMMDGLILRGPKITWKLAIESTLTQGLSSPIIEYGDLLILCFREAAEAPKGGYVCALDKKSAQVKWQKNIGGIFESPLLDSGVLYFGSYDGKMYALDALTGEEKWNIQTRNWAQTGVRNASTSDSSTLYFGYDDGVMYAIDKNSGVQKWSYAIGGVLYARPLITTDTIFFASSNGVVCAADLETGTIKWRSTLKENVFFLNLMMTGSEIMIVWCENPTGRKNNERVVYYTALTQETGERLWENQVKTTDSMSWPVQTPEHIFQINGNDVCAFSLGSGEIKWTFASENVLYPALQSEGDSLFAADGAPHTYKENVPSKVYALNSETGQLVWSQPLSQGVRQDLIVRDGIVCAVSLRNNENGEQQSYVIFIDGISGNEKGEIILNKAERVETATLKEDNVFYIVTKDMQENTYVYQGRFED